MKAFLGLFRNPEARKEALLKEKSDAEEKLRAVHQTLVFAMERDRELFGGGCKLAFESGAKSRVKITRKKNSKRVEIFVETARK